MVRRLAGSILEDRSDHLIVRTPHIPSYWWGNFVLLSRPLRDGDVPWLRKTCKDAFPRASNLAVGIDGTAGEAGWPAELDQLNLEVVTSSVMMGNAFSLGNHADPKGIRTLDADDDWKQLFRLREAWQGPAADRSEQAFRAKRLVEARDLAKYGAAAWFGSFDADQLVGALGIVSDGEGIARYQEVETHPDHRRQGHARRLLQVAAGHARTRFAAKQVVIVADPTYHAIELYRSLGFTEIEQQVQLQGRTAPM